MLSKFESSRRRTDPLGCPHTWDSGYLTASDSFLYGSNLLTYYTLRTSRPSTLLAQRDSILRNYFLNVIFVGGKARQADKSPLAPL